LPKYSSGKPEQHLKYACELQEYPVLDLLPGTGQGGQTSRWGVACSVKLNRKISKKNCIAFMLYSYSILLLSWHVHATLSLSSDLSSRIFSLQHFLFFIFGLYGLSWYYISLCPVYNWVLCMRLVLKKKSTAWCLLIAQ